MRVTMEDQAGLLRQAAIWHKQEAMRDDSIALGIVNSKGELQGVVTIDNVTAYSCDIHIATNGLRRWASPQALGTIFRYCFDVLGVIKIKTTTPHWNIPALCMALHLGFRVEGATKCGAHDGTDGVCFGMTPDQCIWIKEDLHHGK